MFFISVLRSFHQLLIPAMQKSETYKKSLSEFVLAWGEMATAWGINRTMAQIHALLYAEDDPLDTDTVMDILDISRGNANMNIRNLMQWGLVHKVHFPGSRKDYYTAEKDVWVTAATIIRERHQREIEPIQTNLRKMLEQLEQEAGETSEPETKLTARIKETVTFLDMFDEFTTALLPFVSNKNIGTLKQFTKIARMKNSFSKK